MAVFDRDDVAGTVVRLRPNEGCVFYDSETETFGVALPAMKPNEEAPEWMLAMTMSMLQLADKETRASLCEQFCDMGRS